MQNELEKKNSKIARITTKKNNKRKSKRKTILIKNHKKIHIWCLSWCSTFELQPTHGKGKGSTILTKQKHNNNNAKGSRIVVRKE
jgi:hypothetical protein